MSVQLTIGGVVYDFPVEGTDPSWGENVTDAVTAIVDVLNNLGGTGDILTTSFNTANNVSSPTNVTALSFDTSQIRSAVITYSSYRKTSLSELSETGIILITYKSIAATWELAQYSVGDSGMVFTITNAGQVQYTSSNLSGTSYVGKLKFSAKVSLQT